MAEQEYILAPIHPLDAEKLVVFLEKQIPILIKEQHSFPAQSAEANKLGSLIHSLKSTTGHLQDPYYRKPWSMVKAFLYPDKK